VKIGERVEKGKTMQSLDGFSLPYIPSESRPSRRCWSYLGGAIPLGCAIDTGHKRSDLLLLLPRGYAPWWS